MKKFVIFSLLVLSVATVDAKVPKNQYVRITTTYGVCIIRLYNQTPGHRDNFVKLVKQGYYNGTLFHRVIQNFMVQGGDPDSKNAKPGVGLGNGGPDYTIPAEFRDSLFHKRGVIAAARDDIPSKASNGSQFYIAEGKRFTDGQLDSVERFRLKGRKIPGWQREYYKSVGGVPHLDQNYSIFGEVVMGIDMVDRLAAVKKDKNDRPLEDIPMTVELLSKKECRMLDRVLSPKGD